MAKRRTSTAGRPASAKTAARGARRTARRRRAPAIGESDSQGLAPTTIAGVGASAGGLEAFTELLNALPEKPGLALVLVQHLAPQHESTLPYLLGSKTKLPVVQAANGMKVEPNHVYVIPPNVQMGIEAGALRLLPRPTDRSQYMPIDFFLRSLADSVQERAIGVILSGTASDGAVGVREIKAVGGITLAQDPATAKYDGMPRAAVATGAVDLVLPLDRLAEELVRIARHPYLCRPRPAAAPERPPAADEMAVREDQLQDVFALLRTASSVDFKHYKLPTIERRLHRRMALHKLTSFDEYLQYLHAHSEEVQALYQDLLIHVTRFFREPESFQGLADVVFPQLIARQKDDNPIRVWVAGCSTGEEAYSVAITLLECLGDRAGTVPVQIFATDVSDQAIERARNGVYPASISGDVSPERLRRFFTRLDGGYRISKTVRDVCIFARQDLSRDPPFSRLDMVVCRNVLIYMTAALQRKLLTVFHYALKPHGFLMLGHAETIGMHAELFAIEEKRQRIYRKTPGLASLPTGGTFPSEHASLPAARRNPGVEPTTMGSSVQHEANRLVLDRYSPAGVIVDENLQIVQFRGQTGSFLEPAPGDPSMSLLKMAREGLLYGLRSALHAAGKNGTAVTKENLRVRRNGGWTTVNVEVVPLTAARGHHLVLFHVVPDPAKKPAASPGTAAKRQPKAAAPDDDRVRRLQDELAASREYLQSIIQEVEAVNEELQSANEEILSSNEELQSTNEELDTAKEELQSTNEELNTVNEELHGRNEELSRVNSDLMNLLGSVQIAIVIVSIDLRIRRFTPMAERVLNLIGSDVGRPIGHIKPNIDCPDLEQFIAAAIDTVTPQERDVQDRQGNWYSLQVRPYKNVENRIDGAVLALFDVHAARRQDGELRRVRGYADALFAAAPVPMVVLDGELRVRQANPAFCETFRFQPAELESRKLLDLEKGGWNPPRLKQQLEATLENGRDVETLTLAHEFPRVGRKELVVTTRRVDGGDGDGDRPLVLLALADANAVPSA